MQEALRRSLYGVLLKKIADRLGRDETELCTSLKGEMYSIRSAYRSGNVAIAYDTPDRVAAYMLAYFPNYALLTYEALSAIADQLPQIVRVAIVCGGPLPEIVGLAGLLGTGSAPRTLSTVVVDVFAHHWAWASDLATEIAQKFAPRVVIEKQIIGSNICAPWNASTSQGFSDRDLFLFQNCWNEIYNQTSLDNVVALGKAAKPGAFFCFVDQAEYKANARAPEAVQSAFLGNGFEVIHGSGDPWPFKPALVAPLKIVDVFFDGRPKEEDGRLKGEYLTKKYTVRSLIMRKI